LDELLVLREQRAAILSGEHEIDVEAAGILLGFDLGRQFRGRGPLYLDLLDLVRMCLLVVLENDLRRGEIASSVDDRQSYRLCRGSPLRRDRGCRKERGRE
jgi:hypothetical protein